MIRIPSSPHLTPRHNSAPVTKQNPDPGIGIACHMTGAAPALEDDQSNTALSAIIGGRDLLCDKSEGDLTTRSADFKRQRYDARQLIFKGQKSRGTTKVVALDEDLEGYIVSGKKQHIENEWKHDSKKWHNFENSCQYLAGIIIEDNLGNKDAIVTLYTKDANPDILCFTTGDGELIELKVPGMYPKSNILKLFALILNKVGDSYGIVWIDNEALLN